MNVPKTPKPRRTIVMRPKGVKDVISSLKSL
jgi:hypothetical protein